MKEISAKKSHGFSLVELSISIVIIGLILGMVVYYGAAAISSSKVAQTLSIINDLSKASSQFKTQYKSLPGDLPISSLTPQIGDLPPSCMSGGISQGNGDNSIDGNESNCVIEHLYHAGLIKSDGVNGTGLLTLNSPYGTLSVISRKNSVGPTLFKRNITLIQFANLPCEVAQEIDRKTDNDNIGAGNATASTPAGFAIVSCNKGDVIPFLLVAL